MNWTGWRSLLRTHRPSLLLGLGLMLLSLLAGAALMALSGWFITASALAGLGLLIGLDIFTPGAGIRLAAITRTLARYGERLATHAATLRLLTELRLNLMERLLRLDDAQLRALRRGDTLNRLTGDVDALNASFAAIIGPTIAALLLSLIAAAIAAWIALPLALAILVVALLLLPLTAWLLFRAGRETSAAAAAALPALRATAAEGLEGLDDLRALDRTRQQTAGIGEASARLTGLQQRLGDLDALGQALALLWGMLLLWLLLVLGLNLHQQASVSGPILALLVLGALGLAEAWLGIPAAWRRWGHSLAAARRVDQLAGQAPALAVAGSPRAWPIRHELRFDRVSFRYQPHHPWVMTDFELSLGHGEQLLLSGPSGIGKSTLALLLMRQVDPQYGRVLLAGADLRDYAPEDLRARIAWLPQRPLILRDTLARNLRLADPHASDARLAEVIGAVGLAPLLDELPEGLDSWLDEDGANLSGGQRRRLALARLLLTEPDIVLLDEPTASLDPASAARVAAALERWLAGRTALLISHEAGPLQAGRRHLRLGACPAETFEAKRMQSPLSVSIGERA